VALGRLGAPVAFAGRISTDFFGNMLVGRLAKNGVETRHIVRTGQNTTLAFVKLEAGSEPQYAFYTENCADRSLELSDLPHPLPRDTHAILYGSISMTMEPIASSLESYIQRLGGASNLSAPVISFDPNIRPIMIADKGAYLQRMKTWLAYTTMVKFSEADMEYLYPNQDLEAAAERMLSLGPTLVILTLGERGSVAVGRRKDGTSFRGSAPSEPVQLADTIGAGDTFHAAFLAQLERKGILSREGIAEIAIPDLEEALRFANRAAGFVCTRHGAEPPRLAELE
jgi:fructokinase